MSFQQYSKQRCVCMGQYIQCPHNTSAHKACIAHKSGSPREQKWEKRRRCASPGGAHVPLESNFRQLCRSWDPQIQKNGLKNCWQKGKDRIRGACPSHAAALSLNACRCQKYKRRRVTALHQLTASHIRMTRKSAKRYLRRGIYNSRGVENARTRWRGHARSLGSGCCGTRAPAAAQESNTARGAADRVQKYAPRAAAGAGLNSLTPHAPCIAANQSILPRRESLATPSSLSPVVLLPPPHGHGVLANRATPCARLIYIGGGYVCANPPPPADAKQAPNRSP